MKGKINSDLKVLHALLIPSDETLPQQDLVHGVIFLLIRRSVHRHIIEQKVKRLSNLIADLPAAGLGGSFTSLGTTDRAMLFRAISQSNALDEFPDEIQRRAQRGDVVGHRAQLDMIRVLRKGIAGQHIALEHRQIGLEVLGEKAAQHHVTVERHADGVDGGRKMAQHVVQQFLILRNMVFNTAEEGLGIHMETLFDPACGAVSLQTAMLSAAAGEAARFNADMPELTAAHMIPVIGGTAHQNG